MSHIAEFIQSLTASDWGYIAIAAGCFVGLLFLEAQRKLKAEQREIDRSRRVCRSGIVRLQLPEFEDDGALPAREYQESSPIENARRLSRLSLAAYRDGRSVAKIPGIKRHQFYEESGGGAKGFLALTEDGELIHSIAGTDDAQDGIDDVDCTSLDVSNWASANGIAIVDEYDGIRGTHGFLRQAAFHHEKGVEILRDWGLTQVKVLWLCGHSLGGAVCETLLVTKLYQHALVYTYGGAAAFRRHSATPRADVVSVEKLYDPVQWLPPQCKHPRRRRIIIRRSGSFVGRIPRTHAPRIVVISLLYWVSGLAMDLARFVGLKTKTTHSITSGHALETYVSDLG